MEPGREQGRAPAGGGRREISLSACALVIQGRRLLLGDDQGLRSWEPDQGGLLRRRHRLDGRPVLSLAADADGRRVYATQGRGLWAGTPLSWVRLAPGPAGPWRHLAAHPERPGWLVGGDGRRLYRSTDGGRHWTSLRGGHLGPVREARFTACPRDASGPGSLLVWSAGAVWRGRPGGRGQAFLPQLAPRAILEAHPLDRAVYVLAGRLYRWPCEPGGRPEALELPAADLVALGRDPLRPGRLWLLGSNGLRAYQAGPLGVRSAAQSSRTGLRGQGTPRACQRRGQRRSEAIRSSSAWQLLKGAQRRARHAAYMPSISLDGRGLLRDGGHRSRAAGRRLAHSFGVYLSLRWPLEGIGQALHAEVSARARALAASQGRRRALAGDGCALPAGGALRRWAISREQEALESYFQKEEAGGPDLQQGEEP